MKVTNADLLAMLRTGGQTESSRKTYEQNLCAIVNLVDAHSICDALLDFSQAKVAIERHHTTPSAALFKVTAAVVALKACLPNMPACAPALKKWQEWQRSLNNAKKHLEQDNRMSLDDAANMIPLEDIAQKAATLTHASYAESRDKLILTIAAHVFAKRAEWGTVRVVSNASQLSGKENGMVLGPKTCKLIMQDYKTVSTFGRYEEDMPAIVCQEVRTSLKKFPRKYLVQQVRSENPVVNRQYSDLLGYITRKHLGKHINVDRLRRMWVCQRVDHNALTIAETDEIARQMLHSPSMQRYYKRVPTAA